MTDTPNPITKLSDSEVFSKDPEGDGFADACEARIASTVKRLRAVREEKANANKDKADGDEQLSSEEVEED